MNIFPKDKLQGISDNIGGLVNVINEGVKWMDSYLNDTSASDDNYDLKKCRRKLNKIKAAIIDKPVIALFGASQVGKSYMANNLLYDSNNKLMIYNHNNEETIDFIKWINPEGRGNESTSAVTRFTSETEKDKSLLPVKIRVLGVKDIINVLCDSYFYDFIDSKRSFSKQDIALLTEEIPRYKVKDAQAFLNDDDVYEVKEYLEKYFENRFEIVKSLGDSEYWNVLANSIAYIPVKDWVKVFSVLWNDHKEINSLFEVLIHELEHLQFSKVIFANFEAIRRESGKAIINVKTLENFFGNDTSFDVQLEKGQLLKASAAKLCFLSAEIVLSVSEESIQNRPFIKNSDIIDFPGARMRPELRELSETNLREMLLRGKVSYLFNYYSSNYKTNTLCVCMRTQQTNVTTMPRLINQWIDDNLGSTAEIRTLNLREKVPPLFIIFTWWNTQLEFKAAADNPDPLERIEKLFETRYVQEIIGDYKWHDEWTIKSGPERKFTNFYLLRDFKESTNIFSKTDNGTEKADDFVFTNKEQAEFHGNYARKFLEYHKAKKSFFEDPELNFTEASMPNKDGSELIIKNLAPISSNAVSVPIYINTVNATLKKAREILQSHFYSDNADEQIHKAAQEASEIHMTMNKILGRDAYHFGNFIEHLTISEQEIFELNHSLLRSIILIDRSKINDIIFFREYSPRLILGKEKSDKIRNENIRILMEDYHRNSLNDTEELFKAKGIDLDQLFFGEYNLPNKSDSLAETAREYWFDNKLNVNNFQFFIDMGFEKSLLQKLLDNLKANFKKLNLTKRIALEIKSFVDVDKKLDVAEEMIAHITAGNINEFVNSVGWSFYPNADKQKITETNQVNNLKLLMPQEQEVFQSLEKTDENNPRKLTVERLVDFIDNLNENLSSVPIQPETIDNIPMIRNYRRWRELMKISFVGHCDIPTYNIEANKLLGKTINDISKFEFAV